VDNPSIKFLHRRPLDERVIPHHDTSNSILKPTNSSRQLHVHIASHTTFNEFIHQIIRIKRSSIISSNPFKTSGLCSKRDLLLDFERIGWGDVIIFPRRYNAHYCGGRCPVMPDQSYESTNYATLLGLTRLVDRQLAPRPCCVPIRLKAMSMLYYEGGQIVMRQTREMVVDKCGCR